MDTPDNREAPEAFIDKFRSRWPEWGVAIAFVPAAQRAFGEAWLALLQEFADAAWAGEEAAPGLAKLAWWQDELQGWQRGARRHPLARHLRDRPVDWSAVAQALNGLPATRDQERAVAAASLAPLAAALAQAEAVAAAPDDRHAAAPAPQQAVDLLVGVLLAERALRRGGREDAEDVLETWRPAHGAGTRLRRIQAGLLRHRLQAVAAGRQPVPLPAWRLLPLAWRAARG